MLALAVPAGTCTIHAVLSVATGSRRTVASYMAASGVDTWLSAPRFHVVQVLYGMAAPAAGCRYSRQRAPSAQSEALPEDSNKAPLKRVRRAEWYFQGQHVHYPDIRWQVSPKKPDDKDVATYKKYGATFAVADGMELYGKLGTITVPRAPENSLVSAVVGVVVGDRSDMRALRAGPAGLARVLRQVVLLDPVAAAAAAAAAATAAATDAAAAGKVAAAAAATDAAATALAVADMLAQTAVENVATAVATDHTKAAGDVACP